MLSVQAISVWLLTNAWLLLTVLSIKRRFHPLIHPFIGPMASACLPVCLPTACLCVCVWVAYLLLPMTSVVDGNR